jgi:predicted transcriptional regulator
VIWDNANPKFLGKSIVRHGEDIGKVVPVAVEKLITSVLVSPDSDDLLFDVVQKVCDHYELQAPVIKSGVNAPPSY